MNLGFYFNDQGFSNLDLRFPFDGNNGIGGTQYCFLMLAEALNRYCDYKVFFYHYNENQLPNGIKSRFISDKLDILNYLKNDQIDILIFKTEGINDFIRELSKINIRTVAWAHNYIYANEINEYCRNPSISRVVFVSHEMYDRYIDHPIIYKSTYIYNMFNSESFSIREVPTIPSVTYTGSLVPAKGFHILAKVWKKVIKCVPEAQLYVIGDGKLYDRNAELGSFGIAQKNYEDVFIPYLTENGHLLSSVHFLGSLGKEKIDIYNKTSVGIMNPSGRTETFGLSAVEMSACGIPIVTKNANGLLDTVVNGKTGYLINNEHALARRIIKLLKNPELNYRMGCEGKKFVEASFLPKDIVSDWSNLFFNILTNEPCSTIKVTNNFSNNLKWLRVMNSKLHKIGIKTKSIIEVECWIMNIIHKRK